MREREEEGKSYRKKEEGSGNSWKGSNSRGPICRDANIR